MITKHAISYQNVKPLSTVYVAQDVLKSLDKYTPASLRSFSIITADSGQKKAQQKHN